MDAQFWINAWQSGRTGFHRKDHNENLVKFFPLLDPQKDQRVLVPLCGKSKDLLWLGELGLNVHGVELYERAVEAFFVENGLADVQKTQNEHFKHYAHKNITLSCGDFLMLNETNIDDLVYDRGALVALPPAMRKDYAQVVQKALRPGGKCLLVVYEYDPSKLEAPPFSVNAAEIQQLYGDQFKIKLVDSKKPMNDGARFSAIESLKENVYILEKVV